MKKIYLFSIFTLMVAFILANTRSIMGISINESLARVIQEEPAEKQQKETAELNETLQAPITLRILHNNDGESKLEPNGPIGGAAEFKTTVDSLKAAGLPSIMLSSGDNFLAGITFNASLNRVPGLPYYDAEVLDAIGYDAIAIGNHDFDFGPDVLEKMITDQASGTPYLSANLDFSAEPGLQALVDAGRIAPRTIIDVNGEQIGVIGLIYEDVATITSLRNVTVNPDLVGIAQAQIAALEAEGINKIILITHLQSINNELDLIGQLNGVDVVIAGGGDELLTNDPDNAIDGLDVFAEYPLKTTDASGDTVYVVTTPGEYRFVGNLVVDFDSEGNVTNIADESDVVLIKGFAPDADLTANVVDSVRAYAENLDMNIIATTEVALDGTRPGVRTRETNQGNLIADAFLWLGNEQAAAQGLDPNIPIIAMQNGGGIRNNEIIPAGSDISERKTFDMLPFDNSVVVLDPISPDSLKAAMENSVSQVENVSGRFMQIAGFSIVYDPSAVSDANRIKSITLDDGTPIVENGEVVAGAPDVYIVTNSFTASGGDDYPEFAALGTTQLGFSYQRALFEFLVNGPINGTITAADYPEAGEGRITTALSLRILHNNDGESKLEPEDIGGMLIGGAAEFKTAVDSLKAAGLPSIMLSSGDNFLAGITFNASLNRVPGLPYYDAEVLDAIGYDAIAIGNHDFDFGPDVLEKMITDQASGTPYLSANLDFSAEPGLQALVDAGRIAPRTIIDVNGEQIGVIGLIYEDVATITSLRNVTVNPDLVGIAQAQIAALEAEGINKIILITHLQSINNELDLIGQLNGVDVVIAGGGDELLTNDPDNAIDGLDVFAEYPLKTTDASGDTVYVVTTPGEYRFVGNLVVDFDSEGNVTNIADESDVVLIKGFAPDADLTANVVDSVRAYAENLDMNIIATTEVALDGTRPGVRTRETNQGNLIADAFLWLGNEQAAAQGLDPNIPIIAMQNGGGIRNNEIIPAGSDISERKTFDMLPFDNSVVVLDPISPDSLKAAMENSVSQVENVSGRFMQIAGFSIVYDPSAVSDANRIKSITLDDGTPIVENGEVVAGAPDVYIVTNSFTASGGDDYPEFAALGTTQLGFSYQRALFEFLVNGPINGTITAADYPEAGEGRITTMMTPYVPKMVPESDKQFDLFFLGTYATGVFDEGASEIVTYDPASKRLFSVNANANTVSIISIVNPFQPTLIDSIDMSAYGDGVNSVAVYDGLVAVASEAEAADANGKVVFFDTLGNYINDVEVGPLPDMLIFTPDGTKILVANEGEPNDDYTVDPEGSVSIINVANGPENAQVVNIPFTLFNGQEAILRSQGVRIFGPGASAAQDFEPEYIAVTEDGLFAFVSLQENNAVIGIDINSATILGIAPLGYKNHNLPGNGFDASNRSSNINIRNWPVLGMYQPDAAKSINIGGVDYVVTANEGDARDYDGFSEEERVGGLTLDPTAYPNAAELQLDTLLGRLNSTLATGDIDGDGDIDQIYAYGARSFSIWNPFAPDVESALIFDSGDHFEQKLAELVPEHFNSNNDDNDSRKSRSDDKGPEPEAVELVRLDGSIFALIGLERIGGIMIYDITDPTAPEFVNYVNNRDFTADAESPQAGDLGVEDIIFIPLEQSPVNAPLVVTSNEVSGTVSVFAVNTIPDEPVSSNDLNLTAYDFKVGPVPFGDHTILTYNLPQTSDVNIALMDIQGRSLQTIASGRQTAGEYTFQIDGEQLPQGVYSFFVTIDGQANSIKVVKQ